ncbi:MAG: hypothetical protein JO371_13575 [Paraburkholderia sp.]|nr:hypothetical protein [Paraburkholderia sp.]
MEGLRRIQAAEAPPEPAAAKCLVEALSSPGKGRFDSRSGDFFGIEDLLSRAYEDAVHIEVIAEIL